MLRLSLQVTTERCTSFFGRAAVLILGVVLLTQCSKLEQVRNQISARTPHERYTHSLREAELEQTVLGETWLRESERALEQPVDNDLPFQEIGYMDPRQPEAVAYRFSVERGRTLQVRLGAQEQDTTQFFLDLFREPSEADREIEHVASATDSLALTVEISRTGTYLLRVQPELLTGGRYKLTVQTEPVLAFPVAGHYSTSIQSVFGDPREGGRRSHHGVDIFAPRGTPVVAAADGQVSRVGTNELGGKVIRLRDRDRRQSYYYAHLDSQMVRRSASVAMGDTLGLVGNTGNAQHTAPHLHFGIYRRGPVDPYPFVDNATIEVPEVTTDPLRLGETGRITSDRVHLRRAPSLDGQILEKMPRHTLVEYTGAENDWYRVRLPDRTTGYVAAHLTEPADTPIRQLSDLGGELLFHEPRRNAPVLDSLSAGNQGEALGRYGNFVYVRTGDQSGWVRPAQQ